MWPPRIDKPRNIAPSRLPMITKVVRAFFQAGSRKAGTPLEMASTPVTAAPPEAKACITTNSDAPMRRPPPPLPRGSAPGAPALALDRDPVASLTMPTPSSSTMFTMKK